MLNGMWAVNRLLTIAHCLWLPFLQISVVTKFPNLVDLQGPAMINQTDIAEIMGYTGTLHMWHSSSAALQILAPSKPRS
jgi:hypothetical protein